MWFGGSLSTTHDDTKEEKDSDHESDHDKEEAASSETGDSSYTDEDTFHEKMRSVFLTRSQQIQETTFLDVDAEMANMRFIMEARLHFVFFWLNHKENWLKDMNEAQLEFLRDVLHLPRHNKV